MKAIIILAAATAAVPAFAQTSVTVQASPGYAHPACVVDGSCPALAATIARQLGTAAPAAAAVGGPYLPAMTRAPMAVRTAGNYPACQPGPGDDNCIQLYERGVRR